MSYDNWKEREKKYAPEALPTKLLRKIYVHYETRGSDAGKISIWDCDLSGEHRILLSEQMVRVSISPMGNLKTKVVEALENEIGKVQAEAHMKVKELRERIENLLALEYQPESEAATHPPVIMIETGGEL